MVSLARAAVTPVRLGDGAEVVLRDADAERDAARLRDMFYTLSDVTRFLYFCAGVPRTEVWARHVAELGVANGNDNYALVAEVAGDVVGVARFNADAQGGRAEIGILLSDVWQSRGLGRAVVARLRHEATRRAVGGFTATVLGENRRAMRLLRRAFPHLRASLSVGQYDIEMPFVEESAMTVTREG